MMELTLSQTMQQKLILTQEQRLELRGYLLQLQMELVGRLRNEQYKPVELCPNCKSNMTLKDILSGFLDDPNDYTTLCPKCNNRFKPVLVCWGLNSRISLPFFCSIQTLERLRQLKDLDPEELQKQEPAAYYSAIVHFGSLKTAFKKISVDYPFETINGWQMIVLPFLGRMTDVSIASAAGVNVRLVRNLREEHGIPRFLKSDFFDE